MKDESVSDRLRRVRKANGLTQASLAAAAGVSTSSIGNIEAGIRGYGVSVVAIAAVLGTTPDYLRGGEVPSQLDYKKAQLPRVNALSRDAVLLGQIFDWLKDPISRQEVTLIATQAVIERLAGGRSLSGKPAPATQPTAMPNPTGLGRKRRA
jgi:transcriptional regulator with XRE-family HTH domain